MLRAILILFVMMSLAACDSRINPLNWFGGDREQRVRVDPDDPSRLEIVDDRALVAEITQVSVEQTTSGAIVRATGVTPLQGYFDAELVVIGRTPTSVVYDFRVAAPVDNATSGLQEISVGAQLSMAELAGIRSITVIAQNNRRTIGRR
ncbi:MAG: hypothetical protein JKY00_11885 [Roseicyclus sp.]|nr:hypothetical protein [Roseicyclus sp.]